MAPDNTFSLTVEEIDVFDPATNSWTTTAAPLPTPRAGVAAAAWGDAAYFLGGESAAQTTAHAQVEGYAPGSGATSLPDMPQGSHGFGATTRLEHGERAIYTTGGVIMRGDGEPEGSPRALTCLNQPFALFGCKRCCVPAQHLTIDRGIVLPRMRRRGPANA